MGEGLCAVFSCVFLVFFLSFTCVIWVFSTWLGFFFSFLLWVFFASSCLCCRVLLLGCRVRLFFLSFLVLSELPERTYVGIL